MFLAFSAHLGFSLGPDSRGKSFGCRLFENIFETRHRQYLLPTLLSSQLARSAYQEKTVFLPIDSIEAGDSTLSFPSILYWDKELSRHCNEIVLFTISPLTIFISFSTLHPFGLGVFVKCLDCYYFLMFHQLG